ncbi:MAG: hypothetical protein FJ317_01450 [SAR202 cluster bacterium]|nr:hypothetical protein [SAR202 cluster bacterium]
MTQPVFDEGLCEMCKKRPVQYLGLICIECKDAIDRNEEWTLEHDDLLFRLRELEAEEEFE